MSEATTTIPDPTTQSAAAGPTATSTGDDIPRRPYVALIANPYSGNRGNRERVAALDKELRARGLEVLVVWQRDGLTRLVTAEHFRRLCRCVIAAGGDGTLSRVVNHQLSSVPVAHFPLGNENLFARQFGYVDDPVAFADAVARGRTQTVDIGDVNGERFTLVTSAGFDAEVAHRLHAWRSRGGKLRRVKRLSYLLPILAVFARYRYPTIDVVADGRKMRGSLVMIFNLPQYAMDLNIAPHADPTDGTLAYVVFEKPGRFALLRYALATVFGSRHLKRADVQHGAARRIRLQSDQPVPLETDGEATGHLPADICVQPRALTIIVP